MHHIFSSPTMDPHSSAQDVHRCDLCETAIVPSYCDICDVNLCISCIGKHISDGYDKHKIVPFQERRSTFIYPKCGTHRHKNCEFQCKDCNNSFVCSSCMASEQHRGHIFADVLDIYNSKKKIIEKDTEELENLISSKYREIAFGLENQLANLNRGYEKLKAEISKQGDEWHREIDIIINKMITEMNEIEVKHRDILQKHLDGIKQIQSLINQTLLDLKEIEKSTEVAPTMKYSSKIREFSKLPPFIHVSMPTFIPNPVDRERLNNFFGHITELSTATEENVWSLYQPNTSVRELLNEPELVATIQTECNEYNKLRSVICLNEDCIWTSGSTEDINSYNIRGSLLQTIKCKTKQRPIDIAVDSDGNLFYCDGRSDMTVYKFKDGKTEELIRLQEWSPYYLCVTSTGDLLVNMFRKSTDGFENQFKVVRYSGSTEKQTIQFDEEGKSLYSNYRGIKYITENRNHDVCLADCGAGAVVVVNQDGKLRWRYTGHPSVTKKKPFDPYGITTDSQSRILTADGFNHCIHILDQNGLFLFCIDNCDLEYPCGVCVDNNDNLFVCECFKGCVTKIKYLRHQTE